MARIRDRDTWPEIEVRRRLWAKGIRYRLHKRVEGCRPDLVLAGAGLVVFVDGCFWHGCPEHYVPPRSSRTFWGAKLRRNVMRDRVQTLRLEEAGWRVLRVWEHDLRRSPASVVARVERAVCSNRRPRFDEVRVDRVRFVDLRGNREERCLVALRSGERLGQIRRQRSTAKQ
jgi:DNA mismatch endonuclease (patch repair protein)